jgi:hypothetical protein
MQLLPDRHYTAVEQRHSRRTKIAGLPAKINQKEEKEKEQKKMAWYALYKWYKNWSRRNYPNMIDWYSEKLNPPRWIKLDIYRLHKHKAK